MRNFFLGLALPLALVACTTTTDEPVETDTAIDPIETGTEETGTEETGTEETGTEETGSEAAPAALTVTVAGPGAIALGESSCVASTCVFDLLVGDMVDLVATPDSDLVLVSEWTDACAGTEGLSCGLTLDGDATVTVSFEEIASLDLQASKSYDPSTWIDGVYTTSRNVTVAVPASLEIVNGASGNHWATVAFGTEGVICTYKGRASVSKSEEGSSQWNLGSGYDFEGCRENGATSGDYVEGYMAGSEVTVALGESITVNVANGDYSTGETKITTTVETTIDVVSWYPSADVDTAAE